MGVSGLGKVYDDGEIILRQGEEGHCMFVIQEGKVEVVREDGIEGVRLRILEAGDFFGEMALFECEVRSATVRAVEFARVLTVDKKTFFRRVQEDPSLAFNILRTMSHRIRELSRELVEARAMDEEPEKV